MIGALRILYVNYFKPLSDPVLLFEVARKVASF